MVDFKATLVTVFVALYFLRVARPRWRPTKTICFCKPFTCNRFFFNSRLSLGSSLRICWTNTSNRRSLSNWVWANESDWPKRLACTWLKIQAWGRAGCEAAVELNFLAQSLRASHTASSLLPTTLLGLSGASRELLWVSHSEHFQEQESGCDRTPLERFETDPGMIGSLCKFTVSKRLKLFYKRSRSTANKIKTWHEPQTAADVSKTGLRRRIATPTVQLLRGETSQIKLSQSVTLVRGKHPK